MVQAEVSVNVDEFGALTSPYPPVIARRVEENFLGVPKYLRSECDVLVCTECGYIEWYAMEPHKLKE
jgi:hypothetical protein